MLECYLAGGPGYRPPAPQRRSCRDTPATNSKAVSGSKRHSFPAIVCSSRRTTQCGATASPAGQAQSNLIGVHCLTWCGGWTKDEADKAISGSKQAGYDLIEVNLSEPEVVDAKMTSAILQQYDMQAASSLGLSLQTDISSEDQEVVRRGKDLLARALQVTADYGGQYFVGVNYCALAKYPGPPSPANWKNCVASLKEVAARAADLGITYGVEVVNRYETNLLNTATQAMELVGEVGASNLVVHLDTYHMNIEENSMAQAVAACGDKLGYVHVGESHRGYLGTGSVDWQGLFRALADADYRGPITFESFSSRVVSPSLSNALCVWRNLWDDSEDLATQARVFIDAQLNAAGRM